jgi:MFS family permease
VGKSFGRRDDGWAMGIYSVVLSVFFAIAFVVVGGVVSNHGWRVAWRGVAVGLGVVAVLVLALLREPGRSPEAAASAKVGASLGEALRTPLFWVFAGATALFGLISSGFGLFNESILAERGFDQQTFHTFLAVTTLFALAGQMLCGWLSLRRSMPRLLGVAMFLYASGLATLPLLRSYAELWIFAAVFGVAAGFVTVIFFAIWGQVFGPAHLGRIQGAAQMLTVFGSAIGPLLFAKSYEAAGSYGPLLYSLAAVVFCSGLAAWNTRSIALSPSGNSIL